MKKWYILFLSIITIMLFSCNKDTCKSKKEVIKYTPVYASMASLRTITTQAAKQITSNGKIFTLGNYIYLNEANKGFHVINNTNPFNPQQVAFIDVPGNLDLAGYGNYLIADNYRDLLTFDLTNPAAPQLVTRKQNALPYRIYNYGFIDDSSKGIIVDFKREKTTQEVDCNDSRSWWGFGGIMLSAQSVSNAQILIGKSNNGATGQTGSLSRFAVNNNHLYVANRFSVTPVDMTNPLSPVVKNEIQTGEVETIYAFKDHLLMGAPTGMFIYALTNPDVPQYKSAFGHWRVCDPVVAAGNTAYVTLRGGGPCGGDINELDVIDVTNMSNPTVIKRYPMANPYGLGIINNKLGICDGKAGFKLYHAADPTALTLSSTITQTAFYDVIMLPNQNAMMIAEDGLYQYNISNANSPQYLSKLAIVK